MAEQPPFCKCGFAATTQTCRKDGPNQGRPFYGCPADINRCNFFAPADGRPWLTAEGKPMMRSNPGNRFQGATPADGHAPAPRRPFPTFQTPVKRLADQPADRYDAEATVDPIEQHRPLDVAAVDNSAMISQLTAIANSMEKISAQLQGSLAKQTALIIIMEKNNMLMGKLCTAMGAPPPPVPAPRAPREEKSQDQQQTLPVGGEGGGVY